MLYFVFFAVVALAVVIHRNWGLKYLVWYIRLLSTCRRLLPKKAGPQRDGKWIVVSLTTIPSRIHHIFPTMNSLLLQTRPADRIYLHLPKESARERWSYVIPAAVMNDPRITVHRTEKDHGPITKLLPTLELERDPETVIITIDDDTVYPPDMIETLMRYHAVLPGAALGFRGWDIPPSGRYAESRTRYASQITEPLKVDILTGISGVLYLRKHFDGDFFSDEDLPGEGFYVDDIRTNGYLERHGVQRYLIPHPLREPLCSYVFSSRSNPLWKINRDGRNNQVMIDHLFERPALSPYKTLLRLKFWEEIICPNFYPAFNLIFCTSNQYLFRKRFDSTTRRRIYLELLSVLDGYLNRIGVPYWLEWGTLLGCVRDEKMIPWDRDMDVGILHDDHDRILSERHRLPAGVHMTEISRFWPYQKVFPFLALWKRKTFLRLVDRVSGLFVDIFEYDKRGKGFQMLPWMPLQRYRAHPDSPLRMEYYAEDDLFPLQKKRFEQGFYSIPHRPHNILRNLYGEDYMTPDHEWDEAQKKWIERR